MPPSDSSRACVRRHVTRPSSKSSEQGCLASCRREKRPHCCQKRRGIDKHIEADGGEKHNMARTTLFLAIIAAGCLVSLAQGKDLPNLYDQACPIQVFTNRMMPSSKDFVYSFDVYLNFSLLLHLFIHVFMNCLIIATILIISVLYISSRCILIFSFSLCLDIDGYLVKPSRAPAQLILVFGFRDPWLDHGFISTGDEFFVIIVLRVFWFCPQFCVGKVNVLETSGGA